MCIENMAGSCFERGATTVGSPFQNYREKVIRHSFDVLIVARLFRFKQAQSKRIVVRSLNKPNALLYAVVDRGLLKKEPLNGREEGVYISHSFSPGSLGTIRIR